MSDLDLRFHIIEPSSLSCRCAIGESIFQVWSEGWNKTLRELGLSRKATADVFAGFDWVGALCRQDGSVTAVTAFNTYPLHRTWMAERNYFKELPFDVVAELRARGLCNVGTCEYFFVAPESRRQAGKQIASLLAHLGSRVLCALPIDGIVMTTRDDRSADLLAESLGAKRIMSNIPIGNTEVSVLFRTGRDHHSDPRFKPIVDAIWDRRVVHSDSAPDGLRNLEDRADFNQLISSDLNTGASLTNLSI